MKIKKAAFLPVTISAVFFLLPYTAAGQENKSALPAPVKSENGNYCKDCHEGLEGRLKAPVMQWGKSVHGKAGNNCNLCHGGNPAIMDMAKAKSKKYQFVGKPDKRTITDFCGRGGCHSKALEQFKRGPHYESVLRTNQPNCTTCHGTHNIQRSSINIISDEACSSCHPANYSKEIVKLIASIDENLNTIEGRLQFLSAKHAEIDELEKRYSRTKHWFHELVHVFSRADMFSTKKFIELEIRNLDAETVAKVSLVKRLDMLYSIMVGFGLLIIVGITSYTIYMYSRRKS